MRKSNTMTHIFLLPAVVVFLVLTVYPLLYAVVTSFYELDFLKGDISFIGLDNFNKLFEHDVFWISLRNTIIFVIVAVLMEVLLGTALAIYFNSGKGLKLIRTAILLPMLLPPITVALTWKMMYDYEFGIINYLLGWIGVAPIEWLSSSNLALLSIIITDVWQWTPFVFLIILASLQAIPEDIYESASVFGANASQCLRYITLPLLKPAIILVLLLRTIDTFQVFEKMYVLTGGGPGNATETITFYIYRHGFRYFETGYATAASIVLVLIIILFSIFYLKRVLKTSNLS
ncbi:carbohydrate ABC transporter permease [Aquibacillus rhizosphaerae]|uniref:Sugar ABC transporter permease n=1 Tax=Aquibacillus rhizosphaerae TaxID=3051431 RepID=A0ABT7LB96_9BACI|nr:sugar ABC transporter permease [Aquibacillus sp. LR5S19]MDL4842527.1 sugar ABC transporter permease [Aquibacillus sp. LR5S19]